MQSRAIAVGNFDGVHSGHKLLLNELKDIAHSRHLRPAVITFSRHPLALIAPERTPKALQTPSQKKADIENLGVEVIELEFDNNLRKLTAQEFLKYLVQSYNARVLLLGHDNRFGYTEKKPSGSHHSHLELYRSLAEPLGLQILPASELPGISSSTIRKAIAAGNVVAASKMLGHPFSYSSVVVAGKQLGRTIGFPTANISINPLLAIPSPGVYISTSTPSDSSISYPSLTNIGHRPTVDAPDAPLSMEVYLDGFHADLYDKTLTVSFISRLRDEQKFQSLSELRAQLTSDLNALRRTSL